MMHTIDLYISVITSIYFENLYIVSNLVEMSTKETIK